MLKIEISIKLVDKGIICFFLFYFSNSNKIHHIKVELLKYIILHKYIHNTILVLKKNIFTKVSYKDKGIIGKLCNTIIKWTNIYCLDIV